MAVGGQQHGMVTLDEAGELVRDALLWNDNRSARDAVDLIDRARRARRPGPSGRHGPGRGDDGRPRSAGWLATSRRTRPGPPRSCCPTTG